jgi:hypothetical protein
MLISCHTNYLIDISWCTNLGVKDKVFTAVGFHTVFWAVTLCSLAKRYTYSKQTSCLHLYSQYTFLHNEGVYLQEWIMPQPRGPQSKNSMWFIFTFITGVGRSERASKPRHERAMLSICFQQVAPIVANVGGWQTCHKWAWHSVWTIKKQICKTQKRIKTCQYDPITG